MSAIRIAAIVVGQTFLLVSALNAAHPYKQNLEHAHPEFVVSASTSQEHHGPGGAMDEDPYLANEEKVWKGKADQAEGWWWQVQFPEPRPVGRILQVIGDAEAMLTNAPMDYIWEYSDDGVAWQTITETKVDREHRMFRIHTLERPVETRHMRLNITKVRGEFPVLRKVGFYPETDSKIDFPDWALSVNITHLSSSIHGFGHITVARETGHWKDLLAQQVDVEFVDPAFISLEPRPTAMFLSGSGKDWCEVDQNIYRGLEQILKERLIPIWGSCGGCQLLLILDETGGRTSHGTVRIAAIP